MAATERVNHPSASGASTRVRVGLSGRPWAGCCAGTFPGIIEVTEVAGPKRSRALVGMVSLKRSGLESGFGAADRPFSSLPRSRSRSRFKGSGLPWEGVGVADPPTVPLNGLFGLFGSRHASGAPSGLNGASGFASPEPKPRTGAGVESGAGSEAGVAASTGLDSCNGAERTPAALMAQQVNSICSAGTSNSTQDPSLNRGSGRGLSPPWNLPSRNSHPYSTPGLPDSTCALSRPAPSTLVTSLTFGCSAGW